MSRYADRPDGAKDDHNDDGFPMPFTPLEEALEQAFRDFGPTTAAEEAALAANVKLREANPDVSGLEDVDDVMDRMRGAALTTKRGIPMQDRKITNRRTSEQILDDLKVEVIEREAHEASKNARTKEEWRAFLAAAKSIRRAMKVARSADDAAMFHALTTANAALIRYSDEAGVPLPATNNSLHRSTRAARSAQ